jgi:hypothetical protein
MTLVGQYDGEASENYFGYSTSMGDFDGDLKDEFVISAYGWNENMGKIYFYQYDQGWPTAPFLTVQGDQQHIMYGWYVPNLGDVSADGLPDLGTPATSNIILGRMDIYFGSDPIDTIQDWSMTAMSQTQIYGSDLKGSGDVNGDGWADFMMKNRYYTDTYTMLEIYHGGGVLDSIPDWAVSSSYIEIDGLGDVNGDGFDDILACGANYYPSHLFLGGSPMDTLPDLTIENPILLTSYGGGIGDINGDGFNDFCIDVWMADSSRNYGYLYLGGTEVDDIPDYVIQNHFGEPWGFSDGMTCGDFNGDGYSDFAVGSGNPMIGMLVYVYLGGPWFNPVPDAIVTDGSVLYNFGETVACGDVDGDGCDELMVSAINYPWFEQGRVYLFTGPDEWIDYGAGVKPGDIKHVPGWFVLDQNFPNPFNASTMIHFEIGKPSLVNMTIYDLRGNKIKELIAGEEMLPGGYNVSWAGRNELNQSVSSGIYLLEFRVDQYREIRKMVMLR